MCITLEKTIPEQLLEIYRKTPWQNQWINDYEIISYYEIMLHSGGIYAIEENGELVGYYERKFKGNECFLINVWVSKPGVFRKLYKHFFSTMPENIERVTGEKQRLGGKFMSALITKARRG